MKSSIKKIASEAKSRLKSGYWEEMYKSRDEDLQRAKELGVDEGFVHGAYRSKIVRGRAVVPEEFCNAVRKIVERELDGETVVNPIGLLINKAIFDSLTEHGKQRYVLDLSRSYLGLKSEIEREIKLKKLSERV